ncbi:pescadillo homolog [Leptopilina heterotoma]|uniref:pescadillo homolog n=1 Tax=Leptopilina heterotoma TaxID=63436 RepID=UPI001CAA2D0E|nr:pescadillo homolog [Leptopilina heterotoma]
MASRKLRNNYFTDNEQEKKNEKKRKKQDEDSDEEDYNEDDDEDSDEYNDDEKKKFKKKTKKKKSEAYVKRNARMYDHGEIFIILKYFLKKNMVNNSKPHLTALLNLLKDRTEKSIKSFLGKRFKTHYKTFIKDAKLKKSEKKILFLKCKEKFGK